MLKKKEKILTIGLLMFCLGGPSEQLEAEDLLQKVSPSLARQRTRTMGGFEAERRSSTQTASRMVPVTSEEGLHGYQEAVSDSSDEDGGTTEQSRATTPAPGHSCKCRQTLSFLSRWFRY